MATANNNEESRREATHEAPIANDQVSPTAAELAHRIHQGDERAEATMAHRYEPELRRILSVLVGHPEDVEDLLQELWLIALPKLRANELSTASALPAFLRGIARMLARPYWRGQLRRRAELDIDGVLHLEEPAPGPCETLQSEQR